MTNRHKSTGIFLQNNLIMSKAYRELSKTASDVLLLFYCRRRLSKIGSKGKERWAILNNGEIIFPYAKAETQFGISRTQFRRAIDQLIEHGFIDINHHGGGMMGDATTYFISDQWENYGTAQYVARTRPKDTRGLGITKENWEERTGKKRKTKSSNENVTEASNKIVTCDDLMGSSTSNKNITEESSSKPLQTKANQHITGFSVPQ